MTSVQVVVAVGFRTTVLLATIYWDFFFNIKSIAATTLDAYTGIFVTLLVAKDI